MSYGVVGTWGTRTRGESDEGSRGGFEQYGSVLGGWRGKPLRLSVWSGGEGREEPEEQQLTDGGTSSSHPLSARIERVLVRAVICVFSLQPQDRNN